MGVLQCAASPFVVVVVGVICARVVPFGNI